MGVPGIPRRACADHWCSAEKAIYDAAQAVENMGADVRLTRAAMLLTQAWDLVADVVDGGGPTVSNGRNYLVSHETKPIDQG